MRVSRRSDTRLAGPLGITGARRGPWRWMALVSAADRAHSASRISESRSRTRPVPRRSIAIDRSNAGRRRFRKALRIRSVGNKASCQSAGFVDRYVTDLGVKELSRVYLVSISFPQVDNASERVILSARYFSPSCIQTNLTPVYFHATVAWYTTASAAIERPSSGN